MSLNMKSITQALAKTAAVIEKTVQTTVQEVSGPKALQDYDLIDQIGSAGPGLAWRLYSAKASRDSSRAHQYTTVCVWLLDKRALSDARSRAGLSRAAEDSFLDLVRADAARLVRLRHPGVVHVVQALDETKTAMAMVTEPLFASAANALGLLDNLAKVPKELQGMKMGVLEVKHGLLQIAETLEFLHNNARLVHRAIAPENVIITSSGAWKLGGFGFAVSVDNTAADTTNAQAFHYAEYDVEDSILPLQPSLNYTAPELVKSRTSSVGCSSDIFSLGCLAYHLIAHKSLFDCHNNVKMYMNTLNYLSSEAFSSIPSELVPDLQRMLSANESSRPSAMDFTGSPFFRNDTRLRALRFLDHMLERDNMQKSEFLKALSDMWKDFDSRVLRYKVLPPLCAELRNLVMQPMILPMVLTIAEAQEKNDFELSTLPALDPVLSTAAGDTLLLLMKHAELIINKTNQEHLISHVLPMIVRAYDDTDVRIQEEVLRKSSILAKHLDVQLVKQAILPRVHGLALKTTVAAVRVNALLCLGDLVPTLDKHAVLEILQTIQRCTAVDHSAPTLMCTLGVANSILKQYGIEFTAEHVLPLLIPLLTATQLNVQQFAKYMLFVKDILRKIEENRGVTVTDSGTPEMRQNPITNGVQSQAPNQASGAISASTKKSPAWDEDWGIARKQPAPSAQNSTNRFTPHVGIEQSQATHSQPNQPSNKQTASSHLPVDLEWPPRASSGVTLNAETPTNSNFDNMDPFADWPPRQSGQPSGIGASNYGSSAVPNTSNTLNNNNNSWAFDNQTSIGQMRQSQGNSGTTASLGSLKQNQGNSLGFMKQSQGDLGYIERKPADISSIFSNSKSEQSALRLAPPPSTAVGRGQGRGRLSSPAPRSTSQAKKPSEQASLLDLL